MQGKIAAANRKRYSDFWALLHNRFQVLNKEAAVTHDSLQAIIDQLIALSRFGVANVRDAVTEATMSLCVSLLNERVVLRTRLETTQRQVCTEQGRESDPKKNARLQALLKQKELSRNVSYYTM